MSHQVVSVIVAFVAYSMLDLAKAVQKIAFQVALQHRARGALIWLGATGSTMLSSFLLLYAVSLGSVLIVGAMGGSGLAAVTLFSVVVMKERVTKRNVAGIALILLAPILMATFRGTSGNSLHIGRLIAYAASLVAVYLVATGLATRYARGRGIIIGGFSGTLGGLVLLFQKFSTTDAGRAATWIQRVESQVSDLPIVSRVLDVLVNPFAVTWVVLSVLSTLVLQFAYRHGRASRIVPVFAANTLLVPMVGGLICFGEVLHPAQWVGIAMVLCGVALVTVERRKGEALEAEPQ